MARRKLQRPAMPGAGHPPSDNPRKHALLLKLTADERARWRAEAERECLPLAVWIRESCELRLARRTENILAVGSGKP